MFSRFRWFFGAIHNLFRKRNLDQRLKDELQLHIDLLAKKNARLGMNHQEAQRQARIAVGGYDQVRENVQDARGFGWLGDMQRDFRHSLRRLAKSPLLSLVVMLSLGLGIGANTAIFSMVRQILLRSLPVEKSEEIALITASGMRPGSMLTTQSGGVEYLFSCPGLRQFESRQGQNIAEIAGFRDTPVLISHNNNVVSGTALIVSGRYFSLMRVQPFMGRMLTAADDQGAGDLVAVLGYNYWRNRLGGRVNVLNQPIRIGEQVFTIVGVAPKGFYGTAVNVSPDVIIPLSTALSNASSSWPFINTDTNSFWLYLVARLRPGVTREQAAAAYTGVYATILEEQITNMPGFIPDKEQSIRELRNSRLRFLDGSRGYSIIQDIGRIPLYILIAVTVMILLIAMANAANLLLAQSAARRRELAICAAIGAGRGRIVGQLLSEALILAIAGGVMGIAIYFFTLRFLIALLAPTETPIDFLTAQSDWQVLLYGFGLSILTGILFGLYPALQAVRMTPSRELTRNSLTVSESFGAARVRKALVCAQVALSIILLIPTGLLLKSLINLMDVDLGFRSKNLITFNLSPFEAGYNAEQSRALFEQVEQELTVLPGVIGVTSASTPLLEGRLSAMPLGMDGYSGSKQPMSQYNRISPGFFGNMGIPLISGREFTERDNLSGHKVAIIGEQFARDYFPEQNPIGRRIHLWDPRQPVPAEIVGIVKDFHHSSVRQMPLASFYLPWRQNDQGGLLAFETGCLNFYIRTSLPPSRLMAQVRQVLHKLNERVPPKDLRIMEDQVKLSIHSDRMMLQLAGLSASLAVALAMMGLYGIMAYSVVRRTREFGIRIAVGAQSSSIRRMVLREMGIILILGLIIGIPVALAICNVANSQWLGTASVGSMLMEGNALENRLFGVSAFNPIVMAGASIALGLAAFAATYLPACRASHIDPMIALRSE